jgi:hexosaminidase
LAKRYPIIPYPSRLIPESGNFSINKKTSIVLQYGSYKQEAEILNGLIKKKGGFSLSYRQNASDNCILIKNDPSVRSKEGYHLVISPGKIILSASAAPGIFYGIETIRQLLPESLQENNGTGTLSLPAVDISDHPAFSWRGMHLDVARHFFSEAYLKKFIDRMATYKLNRLHLHLTDDQGWRIQIKKYPELTKQGAWRTFDHIDSTCMELSKENPDFKIDPSHIIHRNGKTLYGGYYTQEQMRDIIRYAAARHIQIIPEVDMPGHMMSAVRIFPYLSCTGKAGQGKLFSIPLCPCDESTFTFADNVYKEIFKLFPSKYVHIGGDEVDKSTWAKTPACNAVMRKEGLKDVNQLQSYFIKRMEKFFHANGKTLIGWDDILEGGMDSSATIMYWRNWVPNAPEEAAKEGSDVIMTPDSPLYFDAFPNKTTLSAVYYYNPIPVALRGTPLAQKIIGVQANVWTERIPSEKRADYMTMPRMTALAEVAWTDHPGDYQSYLERLRYQYPRWDMLHIHYRLPDLKGFTDNNVFTDSAVLTVQKPLADMVIHYTTDGTLPSASSAVLPQSLTIKKTVNIKLAAFTPEGNRGDIYVLKYEKESYMSPATVNIDHMVQGLNCIYYKGSFKNTKQMTTVAAEQISVVNNIRVPESIKAPAFGLQYRGYISIPETGIYSFYLTSDDGSILRIGDKTVVDNDGLHSAQQRSGQIALQKGLYPFSLDFIEGGGGYKLRLQYGKQSEKARNIPDSLFLHKKH